ncbi:MAG: L,D-transpeptidase family protein [Steroidobacteraceae bacterium]
MRALVVLLVATVGFMAWAQWPSQKLHPSVHADHIVVTKSQRTLQLFSRGVLLKTYAISLGRHPEGAKTQQGDGRTPEGAYQLDYHKSDSSFHRALHISYPSAQDRANAHAHGVDPGGLVMVHGIKKGLGWLGRAHRLVDWTDGCVAVTDAEIEEIYGAVSDGTPIEIRP